jgi:hypothetical protein
MDQKLPFTTYDFWAYLSSGFLLLFTLDQVLATHVFARDSWTVVNGVLAFAMAYAVGQLVASASSLVFERGLVAKVLGYPRDLLLADHRLRSILRYLIPEYFKPLPEQVRQTILSKANAAGVGTDSASIYWAAYSVARSSSATALRLDNFLNLYGFSRNCALAGIASSCLFYWSYHQSAGPVQHLLWSRLSLIMGIGMTFRYLKFFRHFCVEVFTVYAFAPSKEATK